MTLRYSEGHHTDPTDWNEKILIEISYVDFDNGKCWFSAGIWVAVNDMWFFTGVINFDDIVPAFGSLCFTMEDRIISVIAYTGVVLSFSGRIDFDAINKTMLFREGWKE